VLASHRRARKFVESSFRCESGLFSLSAGHAVGRGTHCDVQVGKKLASHISRAQEDTCKNGIGHIEIAPRLLPNRSPGWPKRALEAQ
jgi:hypothetical protein